MTQLKLAMQANTIDIDAEADELLAEIAPPKRKADTATPPEGDPPLGQKESPHILHSNPDTQSPISTNHTEKPQQNQEVPEQVATLPVDLPAKEGGGGVKNDAKWEESGIGEAPPSGFRTKG